MTWPLADRSRPPAESPPVSSVTQPAEGRDRNFVRADHRPKSGWILPVDTLWATPLRAISPKVINCRRRYSLRTVVPSQDLAGRQDPEFAISLKNTPKKLVVNL